MADEAPKLTAPADLPGDHPEHPYRIRQGGAQHKIAVPPPPEPESKEES